MSRPLASPSASFRYGNRSAYPLPPRRASSYTSTTTPGGNAPRGQPQSGPRILTAGKGPESFETVSDFILSLPHPRLWPSLLLNYFVLDPLRVLAATLLALITSPRTHRVVLRLSVLFALFWTSLILAIFAYIGFYRVWVPDVGRLDQVHLEYGKRGGEMPSALVHLGNWRGGQGVSGEEWFAEEQEYDVSVELLVPISTANLDLGNFMVSLTLLTSDNVTLFHSAKPTILRPTTPPLRFLTQFASHVSSRPSIASSAGMGGAGGGPGSFMLPLPFTSPSLELMTVRLFDRVVLHPSPGSIPFSDPAGSPLRAGARRRISKALVRVGRDDSDKYWVYGGGHGVGGVVMGGNPLSEGLQSGLGQGMVLATQNGGAFRSRGELQTVGVGLRFDARLTGLRYLLYTYPILSFLLFTSLFLAFELISALTLWTIAAVYTSSLPGLGVDLGADNQFVPYRDGPDLGGRGYGSGDDEDEDDGSSTPRRRARSGATPETITATPTTTSNADEDEETASWEEEDTETEQGTSAGPAQLRSRASLRDRDAEERREVQLAAEEEARRTGRLMTAVAGAGAGAGAREGGARPRAAAGAGAEGDEDLLSPTYRRVLGRLDEETEEETDDVASVSSGMGSTFSSSGTGTGGNQRRGAAIGTARPGGREAQGSGDGEGESSSTPGGSSGRTGEGDDEWEDEAGQGDETVLIEGARGRGQEGEQSAREGQAIRRRKAFEEDDEEGGDGASTIGGSATDPSIASGSRRSFGATTQASTSTRQTGTTGGGGGGRSGGSDY